jgi:uncharacterized protein (DUF427 family)
VRRSVEEEAEMSTFRVTFHGRVIAESDATILLAGVRYFPAASVDRDGLERSWRKSLCLLKGVASYYTVSSQETTARHAAWTYRHPLPRARRIQDHVAFRSDIVTVEAV